MSGARGRESEERYFSLIRTASVQYAIFAMNYQNTIHYGNIQQQLHLGQSPQHHHHHPDGNCYHLWHYVVHVTNGKVKTENGKLSLTFHTKNKKAVPCTGSEANLRRRSSTSAGARGCKVKRLTATEEREKEPYVNTLFSRLAYDSTWRSKGY